MLPKDAWFWTFAIAAVAVVVALAIWLGKNVDLKVTGKGLAFKTSNDKEPPRGQDAIAAAKSKVTVGESVEISGKVGRMVGRKVEGSQSAAGATDVAKNAKISGTVDEITGLDVGPNRR